MLGWLLNAYRDWLPFLPWPTHKSIRYKKFKFLKFYRKISFRAVWIFGVGHTSVKLAAVYCGLLIYSQYSTCDPVFNGDVEKYDQMFPYYVMDIGKSIPGLSGLFIVGILSAALSSMSSCLNSLAGTMYQDFLRPLFPNATEKQASTTMKFLVFLIGCICLGLVFVVEKLGSVFSISIAFTGSTYGTLLGLFTMGMLCPKFNKHGAFWGSIISILGLGTMVLGAQIYIFNGQLRYPSLPFDVGSCFNNTWDLRRNFEFEKLLIFLFSLQISKRNLSHCRLRCWYQFRTVVLQNQFHVLHIDRNVCFYTGRVRRQLFHRRKQKFG